MSLRAISLTKAQLERINRQLTEDIGYLNAQVREKDNQIKLMNQMLLHTTSLSIACEKTADAMSHIINDYSRLKLSSKKDNVNGPVLMEVNDALEH